MILIDFRNWIFDKSLGYLPNAQKELLQRDFDTLTKNTDFKSLDLGAVKSLHISSLFFKSEAQIAVSPVKNISDFYEVIDRILEIENKETIDYTEAAEEEIYFHGQDSLVSHSISEIALCGINEKTDESLFEEYCEDFELTPFNFDLSKELLTSDMACFIGNTLLICLDYIKDKKVKKDLFSFLKANGICVITFTKEQVIQGVFDMKALNEKLLISKKAFDLFTEEQKQKVSNIHVEVVVLPFLEKTEIKLRDIIL